MFDLRKKSANYGYGIANIWSSGSVLFSNGKDITKLVGTVDGFGRPIDSETIPVTWELREYDPNSQTWTAWGIGTEGYGNNGQVHAIWWLIAGGDPCDHTYQFRCSIDPAYHQPDGRYELDPAITIAPIL